MKELLDRIESCNYECEAGPLTGNVDWAELREYIEALEEQGKDYDTLDQPDAE